MYRQLTSHRRDCSVGRTTLFFVRQAAVGRALRLGTRRRTGEALSALQGTAYRVAIQISSPAWNSANATRQVTVKRRPLSSRLSQVMRSSCLRISAS